MRSRPDLLLDALKRHAAETGRSPEAANDAFDKIQNIAKGFAHPPVAIEQLMRKESTNGR